MQVTAVVLIWCVEQPSDRYDSLPASQYLHSNFPIKRVPSTPAHSPVMDTGIVTLMGSSKFWISTDSPVSLAKVNETAGETGVTPLMSGAR